jgi:predicted HTH transcriptional regulator
MDPETIDWLNRFAGFPLSDHQRVALAYLRRRSRITNSDYRRLNHVEIGIATRDLRGLVQAGLLTQHGVFRGTYYDLAIPSGIPTDPPPMLSAEERVLAYVRQHGSITNADCQTLLGYGSDRAGRLLARLLRAGMLRREGTYRWSIYRLP